MNEYSELFSLNNKTAVVTGGTSGLGHEIARSLLLNHADVIVCARRIPDLEVLRAAAEEGKSRLTALSCDITDEKAVIEMVRRIEGDKKRVDILVNSAGINRLIHAEDYDTRSFDDVMNINVRGTFFMTREIGKRLMIPHHYGRIINLSSVKGTLGASEDYLAYCTSKGAVNMFSKQIACEWGKYGITCNVISPTFVRTNISEKQLSDPVFHESLKARIPLLRIGTLSDIASGVLYLASDAAAFVTGQNLHIDGGLTARQ